VWVGVRRPRATDLGGVEGALLSAAYTGDTADCKVKVLKLKLKLFTTCAGKLDRLLSLGPLYFAIHDLLASWARVSSTRYTYRYTYLQCVSTFLGS
jgi:hypothetical protein